MIDSTLCQLATSNFHLGTYHRWFDLLRRTVENYGTMIQPGPSTFPPKLLLPLLTVGARLGLPSII